MLSYFLAVENLGSIIQQLHLDVVDSYGAYNKGNSLQIVVIQGRNT